MGNVETPPAATKTTALGGVIRFLVAGVCTLVFAFTGLGIVASILTPKNTGTVDFVEYWSSGKLLLHHQNAYDGALLLPLQRSVNLPEHKPPMYMPNPPWALPLVLPFGFLQAKLAQLLWFALSLALLIASVQMIWKMHGSPKTSLNVLGYTFAPALSCILSGQVTILILFGLVLFFRFHRERPFWAGVALWCCLLKPHLFVPFGLVLLAWIVLTRSYRILAGTAAALGLSTAMALWFDPLAWTHYFAMLHILHPERVQIPCVSMALKQMVWPHNLVIQCVPFLLGSLWALFYFRKHRIMWSWAEHGSLLLLVSVMVAPYSWFMDQAVLLPALLYALYRTKSPLLIGSLAAASALIEIMVLRGIPLLHSNWYLWTAPGWLLWYLVATKSHHAKKTYDDPPPAAGAETAIVNA